MLPQTLILMTVFAGPPDFEPNNGPLTATEFQLLPFGETIQTHDFAPNSPVDGRPDEDWVYVEPIPGTYTFKVTQSMPSPAGDLTSMSSCSTPRCCPVLARSLLRSTTPAGTRPRAPTYWTP